MLSNTRIPNQVAIDVEFGKLKEVMDWCRTNCSGDWHIYDVVPGVYAYEHNFKNNHYVFEFSNERDVITFNLRFK